MLVGWLELEKFFQLQNVVCLVLGNLGRSDELIKKLLLRVGEGVVKILGRLVFGKVRQGEWLSLQLMYVVLGFIKNLVILVVNKLVLGEMLLKSGILVGLWEGFGNSQLSMMFVVVSLGRLLFVGCRENVRLVCKLVLIVFDEKDENGLVLVELFFQGEMVIYRMNFDLLYCLVIGFLNEDFIKFEVVRVVVLVVCRVLFQDFGVLGFLGELEEFYKIYLDIIVGLFMMMFMQVKWLFVRLDVIIVLVFMVS